jgi:peptidoglycan/LPS O-acetylase OafA/YrhL
VTSVRPAATATASGKLPPRLPSLTGARAPGALLIVVGHLADQVSFEPYAAATPALRPATAMVSMFFMLSGFVLTWSHRPGQPVRTFLRRRGARILPLYWLTLALALVVDLIVGQHVALSAITTFPLLQSWIPAVKAPFAVNVPAWSLSVELVFYLLFPLLYRLASQIPARLRLPTVGGLALISLGIAVVCGFLPYGKGEVLSTTFPPSRLPEFFAGIVLALHMRDGWRPQVAPRWAWLLGLAAYVVAGFTPQVYRNAGVTFLPMCLIICVMAGQDADRRKAPLAHPLLVRVGDWSFALYLIHLPIELLLAHVLPRSVTHGVALGLISGLVAIALALLAAKVLHERVEVPMERRINSGRLWRRRAPAQA